MFTGGSIHDRLHGYTKRRAIKLSARLGFGKDGIVWATSALTAIKSHEREHTYLAERDAYARLRRHGIDTVLGHRVPQVIAADDSLGVIEMTIVQPPFLLDFASARLDVRPQFPPDVMEEWLAAKHEEFGEHWPHAAAILHALERLGIFMLDVHPGNIRFEEIP